MREVCFFKQKTAYEMRISDWSSDVCSSDLAGLLFLRLHPRFHAAPDEQLRSIRTRHLRDRAADEHHRRRALYQREEDERSEQLFHRHRLWIGTALHRQPQSESGNDHRHARRREIQQRLAHGDHRPPRSEEHTSELQSLMRITYAV